MCPTWSGVLLHVNLPELTNDRCPERDCGRSKRLEPGRADSLPSAGWCAATLAEALSWEAGPQPASSFFSTWRYEVCGSESGGAPMLSHDQPYALAGSGDILRAAVASNAARRLTSSKIWWSNRSSSSFSATSRGAPPPPNR